MAKKQKKKATASSVVKNGKRVPASEKGKAKKPKAPDAAAEKRAAEKRARKEAVQKNVSSITKMAKTLMSQLHALVTEGWDEPNGKQEALKKDIGGLTGQIASHSAEIRRLAREESSTKDKDETAKIGKSLAGLERDLERWRVKLIGLKEERQGHRETMKAAMMEVRSLIKDKAQGQMRIDDPPEEGPTGAGKAASPPPNKHGSTATDTPASPSPTPKSGAKPTTTPPPSKSQASPAGSTADNAQDIKETLARATIDSVLGPGFEKTIEGANAAGFFSLADCAAKGKTVLMRDGHVHANLARKIFDEIHLIRTGEVRELAPAGA